MHHAHLVFGTEEKLLEYFTEEGIRARGNPDFWHGKFDVFGINESRDLKERSSRKAAKEDAKKIFIISANSFTVEAQNALLKLFEDPVPDTHFFILAPSFASYFLLTLKSRLAVLDFRKLGKENTAAREFLEKTLAERIAFAAKIAKEEGGQGKQKAIEIVEGIILLVRAKNTVPTSEDAKMLERLLQYRDYLSGRSPSVKMILETVAIIVL